MRDYINVMKEYSLWILIRDSLCPPDILSLRTAGRKWNNAKLYGEFAALWFSLTTKNEEAPTSPLPEWPSLCFDYRQKFRISPQCDGVRRVAGHDCLWMRRRVDLSRRGSWRCVIKNAPTVIQKTHVCPRVLVHDVKLSALSAVG